MLKEMKTKAKKGMALGMICILSMATVFAGCGSSSKTADSTETADAAASGDATTAQTDSTTQATTAQTGTKISTPVIDDSLTSLDNTMVGTGYNINNRDENNVPDGAYYYQKLYGQYGAYFLMDTSQKTVYLTMDEGYEAGNTATILDILKEKNVHITFFITKGFLDSHPELVQRMIDEGHNVGNHTCAHPSAGMPSLSLQAQADDVLTLEQMVKDQFGYEMRLFRYPGGYFSVQSLALMQRIGFKSIFWSFAYKDYDTSNQPDVTESLNNAVAQLHPGAIYLLHAVSTTDTAMLGDLIDQARAQGYTLGMIDAN